MRVVIPDNDPMKVRFLLKDGTDVTGEMACMELRIKPDPQGGVIVNFMSPYWTVERDSSYVGLFATPNAITEVNYADFHPDEGKTPTPVHLEEPQSKTPRKRNPRVSGGGGKGAPKPRKKSGSSPARKTRSRKAVDR